MTKTHGKLNLTTPQLLAVVALIIFLVGGILAFQAWLLGVVLSWFGVNLAFWQNVVIVFLIGTLIGGSRSSNWSMCQLASWPLIPPIPAKWCILAMLREIQMFYIFQNTNGVTELLYTTPNEDVAQNEVDRINSHLSDAGIPGSVSSAYYVWLWHITILTSKTWLRWVMMNKTAVMLQQSDNKM